VSKSGIFIIPPKLQQVLDAVPEENDPRSKLDPFKPYILRWRRQGKTYRKILGILNDECQTPVAFETLRQFVKSRSRPRKARPDFEEAATVQPVDSSSTPDQSVKGKTRMSIEERRAQADAIRANFKPLFAKGETKPLFDYDPDKPLTLKPKEK
jgi:hypothetical protein